MTSQTLTGVWKGRFESPAGNNHDFELTVQGEAIARSTRLSMDQTKKGQSSPSLSVNFETESVLSDRFIGILASDPEGEGFNCLALQQSHDGSCLRGFISWNSGSENLIRSKRIEFRRS